MAFASNVSQPSPATPRSSEALFDRPALILTLSPSTLAFERALPTSTALSLKIEGRITHPHAPCDASVLATDCSQSDLSAIIDRLPTQSRYIYQRNLSLPHSPVSSYYDTRLSCYYNHSIQVTYRCDLSRRHWIYVHGNTNRFRSCFSPCSDDERIALLTKYFTHEQRPRIRSNVTRNFDGFRLRCFNQRERRWKAIAYKCGTLTLSTQQWFKLNSCFEPKHLPASTGTLDELVDASAVPLSFQV